MFQTPARILSSLFTPVVAIAFVCLCGGQSSVVGAEERPQKITPAEVKLGRLVDFDRDLTPIFEAKCVACHNTAIMEGKFNIEEQTTILKGGKRGPAVVPKQPEKSLIYQVAARALDPVMPPMPNKVSASPFTPEELGLLRQWILEGAAAGSGPSGGTIAWQPLPSHVRPIYSIALSPWARHALCGRGNVIDVYDIVAGEHVGRLTDPRLDALKLGEKAFYPQGAAHRDLVQALALSPDGTLLASGGFREVKLWQRLAGIPQPVATLEALPTALAVSPNGQLVAAGFANNQIRLIVLADPQQSRALAGHTGPITDLAFTADGSTLYSASKDKSIRGWRVADGQLSGMLPTAQEVLALALTADGARIIAGQADNQARVWALPLAAGKPAEGDQPAELPPPQLELKGHGGPVTLLRMIPGQNQVATASLDGTWKVYDLANGNAIRNVGHGGPVVDLSIRNDGQFVVSTGANLAKLFKIDGTFVADLRGSIGGQRQVLRLTEENLISKSRLQLADASFKAAEKNAKDREEGTKKANDAKEAANKALMEAQTKEKAAQEALAAARKELEGNPNDQGLQKKKTDAEQAANKEVEAVKKAQESLDIAAKLVVQSEKAQQLAQEQLNVAKQSLDNETAASKAAEAALTAAQAELPQLDKPVKAATFSADGKQIVTSGDDGIVRIWEAKSGKPLEEFTPQNTPLSLLRAVPGRRLLSVGDDQRVQLWDSNPDWRLVATIGPKAEDLDDLSSSPFVGRVVSLAFSPDGKLLATGGGDPSRAGELLLWNVDSKTLAKPIPDAHSDLILGMEFSRDGKQLVTAAADKFVKIFDVASGKIVRSLEGHTHQVLDVTWKSDGSRIASAGADNAIKIWNVETGEQQRTIQNSSKQVTSIQFIGPTDNLVSCSGDRSVKMHRANDGGNYRNFGGATDFLYSVVCARDESVVVAGGEDGILRVWNGQSGQVLFTFEPPKPADASAAQAQAR